MSTPSLTMFTATIHSSRLAVNAWSFFAAAASVCRTTVGDFPVTSCRSLATWRAWVPSAAMTRPPASRWPSARTPVSFVCASRRMRGRPSGSSVEIAVR